MVKYRIYYSPGNKRLPRTWSDELCGELLFHFEILHLFEKHARVYWCCGLDLAASKRDFNAVRYWIHTHHHIVHRLLNFHIDMEPEE